MQACIPPVRHLSNIAAAIGGIIKVWINNTGVGAVGTFWEISESGRQWLLYGGNAGSKTG